MSGWRPGNSYRLYNALSIVELLVDMDCEGCERRVRRAISKLDGVNKVEIDMEKQKVTVTGYVEQREVLDTVRRRSGRKAEPWQCPYAADEYISCGYNDDAFYLFSDDNPVSYCSLM